MAELGFLTMADISDPETEGGTLTLESRETESSEFTMDTPDPLVPLDAEFIGQPRRGKYPLQVHFTDLSEGLIDSWLWDFGDGSTSIKQNPVHTYNSEGTFTVKLTVTNILGSNTEIKENYITVSARFTTPKSGRETSRRRILPFARVIPILPTVRVLTPVRDPEPVRQLR